LYIIYVGTISGQYSIYHIIGLSLFAIVSLYNIYEIGYIQNDTETVKKEIYPNMRLANDNLIYYENHKIHIYGFRVCLFVISSFLLYVWVSKSSFLLFEISLIIITLLYQCYNRFRNNSLMFIYFILVSMRYISPFLIFSEYLSWQAILVLLMTFPIVKTIAFKAGKPDGVKYNLWFRKYILRFESRNLTNYRFVAYAILVIIAIFLYLNGFFTIWHILPIFCMFLYRGLILLCLLIGFKPKGYLE
jgi:hypothetical protein